MANLICVRLNKSDASSWGFRLQGGKDFGTPLVVQKVIGGSPAERAGLIAGDTVIKINNVDVYNLRHKDAQDVILRAGHSFDVAIQRGGSTWKPAVIPVGSLSSPRPAATLNNISPVTHTSLAAGRQENIGAIGTSHNVAAKPFHQINGGPKLVNKQYNSPIPIYSDQSIAETLSAQTEVLANGVLGVNFKKNEKTYNANNSEVLRMVQEADKEPRDYESVNRSDFYATHSHAIGGHSTAARATPTSDQFQSVHLEETDLQHSEFDQKSSSAVNQQITKCSDCERVIVGVFVRIKDKNLHVECFKCATCGSSLKNVGYYNLNNKLYCDVHAKLAARNNPPAPNLQPITVPPGGRVPAGTISSALSSHSLPSPSSLSPNINYSAAPYQPQTNFSGHRPFSSVTAPLSPSSHTPKLSPTTTPYSENHSVQNVVWPPLPSEPEFPTASPLYFPPPSQVQPHQKHLLEHADKSVTDTSDDSDYNELEEMSYINELSKDRNMSLCSSEVYNITERRSAAECSETIADTIGRQILVESIVQSRPKLPPPIVPINVKQKSPPPTDVNVSFTISEAQLKQGGYKSIESSTQNEVREVGTSLKETHQQTLASMYEKKIKVENTIPHKWESSMVTALTVASEKPYSDLSEATELQTNNFFEIPAKKSSSAFAAALAVAPAEPFTPASNLTLEPVPLPEETVPYLPPEHPTIIETKFSKDESPATSKPAKTKVFGKKKAPEKDDLFMDLPSPPAERISMLTALTTAPDRPYSPFTADAETVTSTTTENKSSEVETSSKTELHQTKKEVVTKTLDDIPMFKACVKPVIRSYVPFPTTAVYNNEITGDVTQTSLEAIDESCLQHCSKSETSKSTENVTNVCAGHPPMIQVVRSTFETGTDKVQMEMSCQFVGDVPIQKQIIEKCTSTDINEHKAIEKVTREKHNETSQISNKEIQFEQQDHADICQRSAGITESCMLQKAISKAHDFKSTDQLQLNKVTQLSNTCAPKEPITVIEPGQPNLHVPKISFQPVHEDARSSTTFSPRPGSLTPSMINKPAPVLPYYQSSLVATQCTAAETNIFDPASPAISRSPSPYLARPSSPFSTPSAGRPVSPAQGPPPNPLHSKKSLFALKQVGKVLDARSHVQSFIPQHQSRVGSTSLDYYEGGSTQQSQTFSECVENNKSISVKQSTKQAHLCEIGKTEGKSSECTREGNIQIQRNTRVTEEFEHTHKAKEIQIEKIASCSKKVESQQINKAVTDNQAVVGFHITNPQPLKSPFMNTIDASLIKTANSEVQSKIPKKIPQVASVPIPSTSTLSNKNVTKPNVSKPNTGTGGGRQAGAIGVAPKRGRGTLNLAATPGSRVPLCAQCNANIRGPFITALGKIWCPDHFICATASCRRPLHDLGFVEEHGQLYCEYCFEQYLAPPCSKCNAKIKGDCLKAIGRNFHPECFNCVYCGKLFGNSPFFLEDAQPYCEGDWNELFTTKCFACGFPVEAGDRWVEALNNNYHSQCFNCTMCKKNLEGQSFFAKGGRPFCKNHAR